jgi:hypothetical protein
VEVRIVSYRDLLTLALGTVLYVRIPYSALVVIGSGPPSPINILKQELQVFQS